MFISSFEIEKMSKPITLLLTILAFISLSFQDGKLNTDHMIVNNTNENFVITVELLDRSNDPTFGTAMYEIPAGSAMIVSQIQGKNEFIAPTTFYKYHIMSGKTGVNINEPDNWTYDSVSESNRRYQIILE